MKEEFDCTVIYPQKLKGLKSPFKIDESREKGFHEIIIYYPENQSIFKSIEHFYKHIKAYQLGLKKVRLPIDLCHVHVPNRPAYLALKLNRQQGIPFVVTEHWSGHLNGLYQQKSAFSKWMYKRVLTKASARTAVSYFLQKALKENTHIDFQVIPNVIESKQPLPSPSSSSNEIKILHVGDWIDRTKNITGLTTAFAEAYLLNPQLKLILVGDGPDKSAILSHINKLNLPKDAIEIKGRLDHENVLQQMQLCDFYVSFSNFETFGMTIAEALMAGKPVISTLCGGPNEFINSSNAIIIEKQDETALKQAFLQMADNYKHYSASQLRASIELNYAPQVVKEKWLELYRSLLIF